MRLTQKHTGHIYELDYIRAISAILIVLYHYTTRYDETIGHTGTWPVAFPWGSWAVNTLFVLTAFLTVRNFREGGFRFAFKRFARLWPAFAVSVIITSVFMAVLLPERLCSLTDIVLNFTMFPGHLGASLVDGAYWTLPVEIIFYFWIMIFMLGKNHRRLLLCLYGWGVVIIGLNVCSRLEIDALPLSLMRMLFVPERAGCFILGAAIGLLEQENGLPKRAILPLAVVGVLGIFAAQGWRVTLWTAAWAVLVWAVACAGLRFALPEKNIFHRCLVFVSAISYTVYLLHQNIGFGIIRQIELLGGQNQLWILAPIGVSVLLAAAVHYWVELPAGKWLLKAVTDKRPAKQ